MISASYIRAKEEEEEETRKIKYDYSVLSKPPDNQRSNTINRSTLIIMDLNLI